MSEVILKKARMITDSINKVIEDNSRLLDSKINTIEFEFGDKKECYLTDEFKSIIDVYFNSIGATYSFVEVRPKVVKFDVDITNAKLPIWGEPVTLDKGFEIKCLNCGSTDVVEGEDFDEGFDGEYYSLGSYKVCNGCGQRS